MILYDNGFIKLDYTLATDVLHINCPDMFEYDLLFIHQAIKVVVETLINYNIKNFLLDTSTTGIDLSGENHSIVMTHFASDLLATNVQKIARIVSKDAVREKRVAAFVKAYYEEEKPAIEFQNFTNKAAAVTWIAANKSRVLPSSCCFCLATKD